MFVLLALCLCMSVAVGNVADTNNNGFVRDWVIIGTFPNPKPTNVSNERGAFDVDYLKPLGGETQASIQPGDVVDYIASDGQTVTLCAKAIEVENVLNFAHHLSSGDHRLAYAYSEITLDDDQDVYFFVGSDAGIKLWVNGELKLDVFPPGGRNIKRHQDRFLVKLHKGKNRILAKVENRTDLWELVVETYEGETGSKLLAEIEREEILREFQWQELTTTGSWLGYVFWTGDVVPGIVWRDAERVRELISDSSLTVRWFDNQLSEVKQPSEPGRYAAYVEARMKDGTPIRRSLTFFYAPPDFNPWDNWGGIDVLYMGAPVDQNAWDEHSEVITYSSSNLYRSSLLYTEEGAVFLASLAEAEPTGKMRTTTESPEVVNDDFQLALKMKLQNLNSKARPLAPPKKRDGTPAQVLRDGTAEEAMVKPDTKERIDAICRKWAEESGEPFAILVARNGVIISHAAFGDGPDGEPITTDYRTHQASITKAISGMLFSQFIDQGYVELDDPIGNYLPDFPTSGENALTYRHLFTHTSGGLQGHGNWHGLRNPHFENVVLNGLGYLKPGSKYEYNGIGYDLAGKAMEVMTGKSIIRLFHDNLFRPLGIQNVQMHDMGYSIELTSYELGVLGQWIANHGSYGDKQFISEATFKKLLPEDLSKYYPNVKVEWGIGLEPYKVAKHNSSDLILGKNAVGHGSATACILCVDLDHNLVIAQVRKAPDKKYGDYRKDFLQEIVDSLL